MKHIVLASSSPRRQELLKQLGLDFEVLVKPTDETLSDTKNVYEAVCELAYRKAAAVLPFVEKAVVIGADTVVLLDDTVLGKPADGYEAVRFLQCLSGREHTVITGFCIIDTESGKNFRDYESTDVFFRELSDAEINAYVKSGEPLDKAGAYGIQGLGAVLVKKIDGCYYNVVGLPLTKLALALNNFGITVL